MNTAAEALTGWKPEDAAGKPLEEIFVIHNEETGNAVESPVTKVLREGQVPGLANQTNLTSKDGRRIPIDDSAAPIRDGKGEVCGVVLVFRDIGATRRSEEAVRESEARFRQLAESMPQVVWTTTPDGVCDYINVRWTELTGYDLAGTQAGLFRNEMPPEDVQELERAAAEGARAGEGYTVECRFRNRSDGTLRWHLVRCLPVRDQNGKIVKWFGTSTDIHDQKRAEEEIRFRAEEFEAFLDATPALIWITRDPACTVITGNRAANGLLGVPPGANVSQTSVEPQPVPFRQFKTDGSEYRPDELPMQRAAANREWVSNVEIEFRFTDGRRVHTVGNAAPLFDSENNVRGCIGAFLDITERKRAQEGLIRANEDLRQFAFAASHDLQEPLRMIGSYSQLLARNYRDRLDGEASVCVNFIREGAHRMRELLADLLAYTQVSEDGGDSLELVDLNAVFRQAMENLKAAVDESHAVVTSGELPWAGGHPAHFLQLFQNLIGNSIKYRSDRAPEICISAVQQDGLWRVAVKDNGMGIEPEYHAKIFGVFKRLHGKAIPGTGIGLAICQRVVERYGGRIWVESEPGRGATFHFTLPSGERSHA